MGLNDKRRQTRINDHIFPACILDYIPNGTSPTRSDIHQGYQHIHAYSAFLPSEVRLTTLCYPH